MANKPLRPCRYPGCTTLCKGGYCDRHKPKRQEGDISDSWHSLYSTRRWRELRAAQLVEEPWCQVCAQEGRRVRATDVDHIRPHRGDRRLFFDPGNLQSLCHSCHSRKTMEEIRGRTGR